MFVSVYWNLHRSCWSIQHKGKVVGHADSVFLENCRYHVNQNGRLRVLRDKCKNVHAYVKGDLIATNSPAIVAEASEPGWEPVRYNPYKWENFVDGTEQTAITSRYAVLNNRQVFALDLTTSQPGV